MQGFEVLFTLRNIYYIFDKIIGAFMNVAELIEKLKSLPQDMTVVADSYEDGYDIVRDIRVSEVAYQTEQKWYYGRFTSTNEQTGIKVVRIISEARDEKKWEREE